MKSTARSVFARLLFAIAVSCACARAKADKYLFAYFKGNETAAWQIYFALGAGGFDFAPLGQKPFIAGAWAILQFYV